MSNITSYTRDQYIESLKSVAKSKAKTTLINLLITRFPFLAWGPLGFVVGLAVGKIVDMMIEETELRVFFLYTDFRVNQQAKEFSELALAHARNRTPENEAKMLESFTKFASLGG